MSKESTAAARLVDIDIENLIANPRNLRREVAVGKELIQSVAESGLIEPLVVTPQGDDWLLVAGHRRLQAAVRAGLASVPCIVRDDLSGAADQIVTMLGENGHRTDLTVSEEADAYQALLDLGVTTTKVAKRTGRSKDHVTKHTALATAGDAVRAKVDTGKASLDDVLALAEFEDDHEAYEGLARHLGGYSFTFFLEQARLRRVQEAARDDARQELTARGVRIASWDELADETTEQVGQPDEFEDVEIDDAWEELDAEPEDPTAADVRAVIDPDAGESVVWMRRRTEPAPDRAESEAQAQRRRDLEEREKLRLDIDAAARVRWAHLATKAREITVNARAEELLRNTVRSLAEGCMRSSTTHDYARAILGLPHKSFDWQDHLGLDDIEPAVKPMRLHQLAAVAYLLEVVPMLDYRLSSPNGWRNPEDMFRGDQVVAWQEALTTNWGYELAAVERDLVIQGETARAAADTSEDEAGDGAA